MTWFLLVLLGVLGGVVSGLFGVGGAIVIVPGLVLIAGLSQHHAHGTSLAALAIPLGIIVGALQYYKRGQVHLGYAVVIAAGMIVGAYIGSRLAGSVSDVMLRKAFGGFLLLVSAKLLLS
jgi:uncharacterized protein